VRWPGGAVHASHGRTEHCDCTKHGPVHQDQPRCDNIIVLRDPRSRQASHFRYRRLVERGTLPPRASVFAVAAQQDRETRRLRKLFIGGYDAGGTSSALPFRYELLASPRAGPTVLRDIDAYLGLPTLRGAPLSLPAARAVLDAQAKDTLARKCRDGKTWNASLPGCPAERPIQLYRTRDAAQYLDHAIDAIGFSSQARIGSPG